MAESFNIPGPVDEAIGRKKRQLVKYIKGKANPSGGPSMASGQSNRQPKQYPRGSKRTPFRRP